MEMETIIVTRHRALVAYLAETMPDIVHGARVIEHATVDDIRGKHVIGVLPMRLAVEATSVTEIPMDVPAELRGQELDLDKVRQFAGSARHYVVSTWAEAQATEGLIYEATGIKPTHGYGVSTDPWGNIL